MTDSFAVDKANWDDRAMLHAAATPRTPFTEHDSVPWNTLPGRMVLDEATGEWRLEDTPSRLAASYTLQAVKAG